MILMILIFESCEQDSVGDGFIIRWQSIAGKAYTVTSSTNIPVGFDATLITNILATPPQNCYTDTTDRADSVFYRILLDES